jgi:hypothetical protein
LLLEEGGQIAQFMRGQEGLIVRFDVQRFAHDVVRPDQTETGELAPY